MLILNTGKYLQLLVIGDDRLMKSRFHRYKMKLLSKFSNPQSLLFHIVGIVCILWFLFRVLPKPDRIRYPCQQMSITVASGYIIFWSILWSSLFHGLAFWVRHAKTKTTAFAPVILVSFVLLFSVSSGVFADIDDDDFVASSWEPIPNEPIGTPLGVNPGRVAWVWNPNATESDLKGYWWLKNNNNQEVIDEMFSEGLQGLTNADSDEEAWDALFKYFNLVHGNGEVGYQPGEKIAIKVNLNNCYQFISYFMKDNDLDANPYVIKALLRQLISKVGVAQEDITIYDASRIIPNWFYRRVYYETFPSLKLVPEFPNVNFVDNSGLLPGRKKVEASSDRIYFADGTGLFRTLPTCVVDSNYIVNMPILKRHPIRQGVTLSGKNFFGTWIEPVMNVHDYHKGAFTSGNPAPQTDLLAHEDIGGKTILYIGDGIYPTKVDQRIIAKFQMHPFNDDWTNSLFFSQDPVAIDSVMYDFLHAEGTDPVEGSQYYLHQSAEPLPGVYDPENDGIFLSESLGVHEHWNKSVDIFSSERYLGPSGNGIDFVAIGKEHTYPAMVITQPKENYLYFNGEKIIRMPGTIIIGDIVIKARVNGVSTGIDKVEFYIDQELVFTDFEEPYEWPWEKPSSTMTFLNDGLKHEIETIAYYDEKSLSADLFVWRFR